ncbi:hypothetical protein B0H13DRAFT_2311058 [Mycena leptocephala]|nr:hypothetical protein B0H13DRAFT_2311058 [Mycena leptocephala]
MTTRPPPAKLVVAASRTLPANPQLYHPPVYQADTVAPSLASGTTTHTQKLLRNRLLRTAQFCAVTGSASESIQACYVLNTVRKRKGESTEEAQARRVAVEDFLMDCGILKGGANLLLRHFNFYVINSTGFLPNGEPLALLLRLATSQLVPVAGNAVPLVISLPYDLSTVSVIINANEKIEHAQRSGWILSNNVSALKVAIEAFFQEFFFYLCSMSRTLCAGAYGRRQGGYIIRPFLFGDDPQGMTPAPDRIEEAAPGLGSDGDGSEYEDEDEEFEEESDDDRTLPTEEFWEGLQKVKDPTIPIQDRMAIASLLLVKRPISSSIR